MPLLNYTQLAPVQGSCKSVCQCLVLQPRLPPCRRRIRGPRPHVLAMCRRDPMSLWEASLRYLSGHLHVSEQSIWDRNKCTIKRRYFDCTNSIFLHRTDFVAERAKVANTHGLIQKQDNANGLEPMRYLSYILTELPQIKQDDSIEHLLAWNLTTEILNQRYEQISRP